LTGLALVGATVGAGAMFLLVPIVIRGFVIGIKLLAAGCVWLATSLSAGVSVWTLLATIARAAASSMAAPAGSALLWVLVLVGVLALYWLERLLDSKGE
jgi:hypothetical protein